MLVITMGGHILDKFDLPQPHLRERQGLTQDILRENNYNPVQFNNFVTNNELKLVQDQRYAYDTIVASMINGEDSIFFLDAHGGTGKTLVLNPLLARIGKDRHIALAVASSGIAATPV